jgi:rhodanese-related sulfurtransferase
VRRWQKLGFTKAFSLDGGLNAWIKDNMPVTRSAGGVVAT